MTTQSVIRTVPCVPVRQSRLSISAQSLRTRVRAHMVAAAASDGPLTSCVLRVTRPTLTANGMPSSTHTASLRLPLSLQPPSPSRPTPLELVGVLATSAAVACAKPPSAPCGARSKRPRWVSHATSPPLVALLALALVLDASTLPRIMRTLCRMRAFLALLALDVARTLLGVMSLNSRIRFWRLLRWTAWKP